MSRPRVASRAATPPCTPGSSKETASSPSPATARATTQRPAPAQSQPPEVNRGNSLAPSPLDLAFHQRVLVALEEVSAVQAGLAQSVQHLPGCSRAFDRDEIRVRFPGHPSHGGIVHPRGLGTDLGSIAAEDERAHIIVTHRPVDEHRLGHGAESLSAARHAMSNTRCPRARPWFSNRVSRRRSHRGKNRSGAAQFENPGCESSTSSMCSA